MRCEDFPCCGHTDLDPCERQWYDEPNAFSGPHAFCDHENGDCDVEPDWDDEDEDEGDDHPSRDGYEDAAMEYMFGDC